MPEEKKEHDNGFLLIWLFMGGAFKKTNRRQKGNLTEMNEWIEGSMMDEWSEWKSRYSRFDSFFFGKVILT